MNLIPVESVPQTKPYHRLQDLIEEFVKGDAEIVRVDFSESDYKSATVVVPGRRREEIEVQHQGMASWKTGLFEQGKRLKE